MASVRRWLSLVFVLLVSCGGNGSLPPSRSSPAVNAASAELLPTDVYELPDFTFDRFQELLSQLQGIPVVVNIWGSWCAPCREEGPRLAAVARKYGREVQFVGLDVMDTKDAARDFIEQEGWNYPSLFDPTPEGDIRTQLGYLGAPHTIFYDESGNKVYVKSGPIETAQLEEGIRRILR
jgi:cytochrome c biogenesis protein CcmG/thiol:disulfide interchange protein DsbE